jgi:hypothetical protein
MMSEWEESVSCYIHVHLLTCITVTSSGEQDELRARADADDAQFEKETKLVSGDTQM